MRVVLIVFSVLVTLSNYASAGINREACNDEIDRVLFILDGYELSCNSILEDKQSLAELQATHKVQEFCSHLPARERRRVVSTEAHLRKTIALSERIARSCER